jgi:hypothetical protein
MARISASTVWVPGLMTPGQRIAIGTRHPPSQLEPQMFEHAHRGGGLPACQVVHFSPESVPYPIMILPTALS